MRASTDGEATLPRGTIKSFREYLNAKFGKCEPHINGRYQQKKRMYGDYIYNQDREQFMVELQYALEGNDHKDWVRP